MPTVLIVDDSAAIRESVRACIEEQTNCKVCGEAENGQLAVERVKELRPDVVILDLQMPVMSGLEAARKIASIAPNTTMLMLTMHVSDELLQHAQEAGIERVLSKSNNASDHLIAALRNICDGSPEGP